MINKLLYKLIIECVLCLLIVLISPLHLNAQLLDTDLQKQKKKIIVFFKAVKEISDSTSSETQYFDKIYSRKIFYISGKTKVSFFEIGITASHSKRYLLSLYNNQSIIYKTVNLIDDIPSIVEQINKAGTDVCSTNKMINFLKEIADMYSYNLSPPWKEPKVDK